MHTYVNSIAFQRALVLAIFSVIAIVWFLTVPVVLTQSSFVALFGFLGAFAWVLKTTYVNARPASSLAQCFHDPDTAASGRRAPRRR